LTGKLSALIGACAESKKEIDRAEADRGARQRSRVAAVDKSFMVAGYSQPAVVVNRDQRMTGRRLDTARDSIRERTEVIYGGQSCKERLMADAGE
jgi:hypothetical protein